MDRETIPVASIDHTVAMSTTTIPATKIFLGPNLSAHRPRTGWAVQETR